MSCSSTRLCICGGVALHMKRDGSKECGAAGVLDMLRMQSPKTANNHHYVGHRRFFVTWL